MSDRRVTCITIREDLWTKAAEAVERGLIPGVTTFSGFIDYALRDILSRVKE